MKDHLLSAHHIGATVLWVLASACMVAELVTHYPLGHLGVLLTGGAAVTNIRGYICAATAQVLETEANAFELGRDAAEIRRVH